MSCNDSKKFKTAEASTKSWMRTKGIIDKYLNILNYNEFVKQNNILSKVAKDKYYIKGKLFDEYQNKVIPNRQAFKDIDNAKGIYYQRSSNEIEYSLTAINILQSQKGDEIFRKGDKNNWDIDKILFELQIPKEQQELIKSFNTRNREEILTSLLANYSYTVEINTATKEERAEDFGATEVGEPPFKRREIPTQHYSNLTVPGGTNYTEQEIVTKGIIPSIKGHAQFSTDNGIGWFRSDDKTRRDDVEDVYSLYIKDNTNQTYSDFEKEHNSKLITKTRRILEVQSDLFQKGRDKNDLVSNNQDFKSGETPIIEITNPIIEKATEEEYLEAMPYNKGTKLSIEPFSIKNSGRTRFYELGDYFYFEGRALSKYKVLKSNLKLDEIDKSPNKFLQLLNKDNNWVTFFVKSIIQDSAKKGYEKVLFPKGETAAKIEGHNTLVEEIKKIDDRILEHRRWLVGIKEGSDTEIERLEKIEELEKEKQNIKDTGIEKLKPIEAFYEIRIANILDKIYGKDNVIDVTDEYGNSWNEIDLGDERAKQKILLQKQNKTVSSKASSKTLAVVNDFLKRIGVDVKKTKQIVVNGIKLDVNAVANLTKSLIEVVDGKEASSLPEEAMHFAVEIIEQTNPSLFKQLLKEINDYDILKQVFIDYSIDKNYQTSEGKPNVLKLKKEAIAKVLVETIINKNEGSTEKPELLAKSQSWWNQFIEWMKGLIIKSGFDKAAKDILLGKDIGTTENITGQGLFFQKEIPSKQNQIYNKIKEISSNIVKDDDGYLVNGKRTRRVTDLVKGWYERRFTSKDLTKSEYQKAVDDLKAEKGTAGHHDLEYAFKLFVDENGNVRDVPLNDDGYISELNPDNRDMYELLRENLKERINSFPQGTKFMSEATVYDSQRNIAGTVDFLTITPEGKVNILDWKFMDLNTEKYKDIPWYKVSAWNTQMDQYKYIISRVYNIKNEDFQQTRMIPIKSVYSEGNRKKEILPKLLSIKIGDVNVKNIKEDYLIPVGIEGEKTGNKKIDTLLEKLNAIYKKISEQKVITVEKQNKAEQLNALFYAIRQLQMKENIKPLLYQANVLNKQVKGLIDKYNSDFKGKDKNEFSEKAISEFSEKIEIAKEAIDTYLNLDNELRFLFENDLTEDDKKLKEELRETVDNARYYSDELNELDTEFITNFIGGTSSPEKIIRGLTKFFSGTATLQLKALETLYKKSNKIFAYVGIDVNKEVKRLTELKSSYESWASSKGLTKNNMFDIIKKKTSNELIDEFDSKFYSELRDKIENKDFNWIKENIDISEYTEYINKKKEEELQRIDNKLENGIGTEQEKREHFISKQKTLDLYNVNISEGIGWLLYNDIKKFPKKEIWYSEEWKILNKPENKPAKSFYDYIIERNEYYRDIDYIHAKQARVFLPWVRKGTTEKLIFDGKLSLGESFLRNISVDEGDVGYGKIDPLTGKPIDTIPKYLTTELEGDYSTDLFKTMVLYNEFAIKFKYLSEIEAQARALVRLEKNKKAIATSKFGKTEYKDGILQINPDNSENAKLVEDMVKAIIYQQRYIESESFDQLLNKFGKFGENINKKIGYKLLPEDMSNRQLSINKIITQTNNVFQLTALGLNTLSSLSNLFGGKTQSLINSGKYFTKSDYVSAEMWLLAHKMGGEDKKKMMAALDYFIPFTENYNRDAAKNLSISNLTDQTFQDFLMILMRTGDRAVQTTNFFAFARNTIVQDGQILNVREYLRTLPEYKDFYKGTYEERELRNLKFEEDVKKLNEEKGILKIGKVINNEFIIEGVDQKSDSVVEFRRKVQQFTSDALGNMSEENKRLVNLTVYGNSFMVFKNWIPRLVDVRMGNLKYNSASDAYEWGRARMITRIISEDLTKALDRLYNALKGTDKGIEYMRDLYERKKNDYELDTGKTLDMTESEFIDLVRQNIKNQLLDVIVLSILFGFVLALKALPPDDDEDPRITNTYRFMLKATDKLKDELQFFYDPTSYVSLVSGGIFPSMNLILSYKRAISHFMTENFALMTGNEELEDKNHVIKYWMKSFPITNQAASLLPLFYPELAKDLGIRMQSRYGMR